MTDKTFGTHLTLDIENCDKEKLMDNKFIYHLLDKLPKKIGMKAISPPFVIEYKDEWASSTGLTGFVIIATSHLSVHTFPDNRYVFFDIFSCTHFETKLIANEIMKSFGSNKSEIKVVERGRNFNPKINFV